MLIFEYLCPRCNERFAELHGDHGAEIATCPACGHDAPRQISPASFLPSGVNTIASTFSPCSTVCTHN